MTSLIKIMSFFSLLKDKKHQTKTVINPELTSFYKSRHQEKQNKFQFPHSVWIHIPKSIVGKHHKAELELKILHFWAHQLRKAF